MITFKITVVTLKDVNYNATQQPLYNIIAGY